MSKPSIFDDSTDLPVPGPDEEHVVRPDLVQEELHRIVTSRHFRTSRRSKEFLQHVVDQTISGNGHLLKERLIGAELFGRKPDYGTGEDPVVRVQAGDVRRRLESYNTDPEVDSEVMIQIPVGSYAPVFLFRKGVPPHEAVPDAATNRHEDEVTNALPHGIRETTSDPVPTRSNAIESSTAFQPDAHRNDPALHHAETRANSQRARWWIALPVLLSVVLGAYLAYRHIHRSTDSTVRAFWLPASISAKPVLICLPRPIVYRPSEKLYDRYEQTHPKTFDTRESRRDQVLPLAPTDVIQWGDMGAVRNSGPGIGAVVAAVNIAKLLAEQGIRFELRFGDEATYADMRDSPVVLVGGINTQWSTQLTAESAFVFDESLRSPNIHETAGAKREWKMESSDGNIIRDYGLITRQSSGKAGQFLVQVAGISHFGTGAASELLANKEEFAAVLRAKSISLKEKNLQVVVSTEVTAGRAGPPHVVAVSAW